MRADVPQNISHLFQITTDLNLEKDRSECYSVKHFKQGEQVW